MEDITTQELRIRIAAKEAPTLIDVREPYEHDEFNIGGKLIPLGSILSNSSLLDEFDKDNEIAIYCRSGNRSNTAKHIMQEMGFSKVRNVLGGMIQWQEESTD